MSWAQMDKRLQFLNEQAKRMLKGK